MASFKEIIADVRERFSVEGKTSSQHEKLLQLVKNLKRKGEESISSRIGDMQYADDIYRAFRRPDADDKKAKERGEPSKIVYPITYAQIQTAAAQMTSMFCKSPYIPLKGRGPEDYRNTKLMEMELTMQLENASYGLVVFQWCLDMLKYGFGKLNIGFQQEYGWVTKERGIIRAIPALGSLLGIDAEYRTREVVYEGADLCNEDPYLVSFDPDVSIGNFQKGNFIFSHKSLTYNELKDSKEYFNLIGLEKQKGIAPGEQISLRRPRARQNNLKSGGRDADQLKGGDWIDLDVCYVKLVPADYELASETETQIWKIVLANDDRLVQIEPSQYEHGMFPSSIIEYSPDLHEPTNDGMAQTIEGMSDLFNWLINSHMESVRKTVNNQALIDPEAIYIEDLEQRRNYIRMKRGKSANIDRVFKQLMFQDVTQSHINDSNTILQHIFRTTGFNDNFMGLQLPTGRTATEVASMQRLGSVRAQLLARLIFEQGVRPMAKQLVQNTQQFLSMDRLMEVTGNLAMQMGIDPTQLEGSLLRVSPTNLRGLFDIQMVDINSSQDNFAIAGVLKEVLMMSLQNPQAAVMLGVQPQQVINRIFELLEVPGASDLLRPVPAGLAEMQAMMAMGVQNDAGVKVEMAPDEMIRKEQEKGNLIPFSPNEMGNNGRFPNT